MTRMDWHDVLYGDPKRVAEARVQARARIAVRRLFAEVERLVRPVLLWLVRVLS